MRKKVHGAWDYLASGWSWYVSLMTGLAVICWVFGVWWSTREPSVFSIVAWLAFIALGAVLAGASGAAFEDNRELHLVQKEMEAVRAAAKKYLDDSVVARLGIPPSPTPPQSGYAWAQATMQAQAAGYTNSAFQPASLGQANAYWQQVLSAPQAFMQYQLGVPAPNQGAVSSINSGLASALWPDLNPPKRGNATVDSLPEESALIRGWRTYRVNASGELEGSRAVWKGATFEAKCGGKDVVADHLLNGCSEQGFTLGPECGIYSHKTGPEYLKLDRLNCGGGNGLTVVAQCISSGVVAEHEFGYRAEKCRIEQMWLIEPRGCGKHPLRVSTGAITDKWLYDPLSMVYVNSSTGQSVSIETLVTANPRQPLVAAIPSWRCQTDGEPVANPGAAYAQVLSTKYGVPCTAIGVAEFLMKLDEGSL